MIWDVNTDAIGVHRPPDTTGYWPSPVSNVNPHVNLDVEGSVNVEWENPAPPLVGQPVNFRGYCINGFGCLGTIDGQDRNLWNIHNIIAPVTPVFTIDATNAFFQGRFNASVNYNWEDAQVFYYRNLSWNAGNQFSLTAGQDGGMVSVTQGSAPWVYTPENPLPPPPPPPGWESDKVKILRLTAAEFEGNSTWIEIDTSHHIIFYVNSEEVLAFPPHGNITLNKLRTTNPGSGTRQLWADPADGFRVKWAGPGS
jgi:hypothetical protein